MSLHCMVLGRSCTAPHLTMKCVRQDVSIISVTACRLPPPPPPLTPLVIQYTSLEMKRWICLQGLLLFVCGDSCWRERILFPDVRWRLRRWEGSMNGWHELQTDLPRLETVGTSATASTLFMSEMVIGSTEGLSKIKLRGLSPRANYADLAAAAFRRSWCQLFCG
jgi:hypothetical protein